MKMKMTVNECLTELREQGFPIGIQSFYTMLDQGYFPFVKVISVGKTGRRQFLILRKEFQKWCDENL